MATNASSLDYSEVLTKALDLAKVAGSMIKEAFNVEKEIDFKGLYSLHSLQMKSIGMID